MLNEEDGNEKLYFSFFWVFNLPFDKTLKWPNRCCVWLKAQSQLSSQSQTDFYVKCLILFWADKSWRAALGALLERNKTAIILNNLHGFIHFRFAPVSSDAKVTLYWIRTNSHGSDNAAIQQTPLDSHYRYSDTSKISQECGGNIFWSTLVVKHIVATAPA